MILLWAGVLSGSAQEEIALDADTPIVVTVGDDPAWLHYEGKSGEVITISTMTAVSDTAPDTTLEILYPDGTRLDYVDDVIFEDGSFQSDAVISDLTLPISGTYRIRVDVFNGVTGGEVMVQLTYPEPADIEVNEDDQQRVIRGVIPANGTLDYEFDVSAGDVWTIYARDLSGGLDPILQIEDDDGDLVGLNDDHASDDLTLDVLDSRLPMLSVESDGVWRIMVRDYLGRRGRIEVVIRS